MDYHLNPLVFDISGVCPSQCSGDYRRGTGGRVAVPGGVGSCCFEDGVSKGL